MSRRATNRRPDIAAEDLTGLPAMLQRRPLRRSECAGGFRPCPWVSCRHHLGADVMPSGKVKEPNGERWMDGAMPSCSLDLADDGAQPLKAVGQVLGVSGMLIFSIQDAVLDRLYLVDALREEA